MKNRWLIALAAVGIHISIGSIYAYSVLKIPLFDHYGWADAVKIAFSIAIVFLGLSAAFMGHFVERYGPRRAGMVAAVAYGLGVFGSGLACWLAASALNPTKQAAFNSEPVQVVMVQLQESLQADLRRQQAGQVADVALAPAADQQLQATQFAEQAIAALLAESSNRSVGMVIDELVVAAQQANAAIGVVAADDEAALAAAQQTALNARMTKEVVITALLTPVAAGWQWMFLIFYGVCGGIGLGVGYIAPVSTLVKWFPDRRGLATGLAIMGFGFASLIFAPTMNALISAWNPAVMFFILGAVYCVLMLSAAAYLAPPPPGWIPAGMQAKAAFATAAQPADLEQLTANEAIKTSRFYFLWVMLFVNVTCGIALISVASPMAQEMVGLSPAQAATMVGLMGLFNGLGRIGWAAMSDYIGRANTYVAFFVIQMVAFLLLPFSGSYAILFQLIVFLILTCYGGGFASIPAFIGDIFGTKQLGAIHGYILTAWAAAGVAGPITANFVREATGDYALTLMLFAMLFVVALIVSLLMRFNVARIRRQMGASNERAPQLNAAAPIASH